MVQTIDLVLDTLEVKHLKGSGIARYVYEVKSVKGLSEAQLKALVKEGSKYFCWLPAKSFTGKACWYRPSWADKRDLPQEYKTWGNEDDAETKFQRTADLINVYQKNIEAAVNAGLISSREGKERLKTLKDKAFKRLGI